MALLEQHGIEVIRSVEEEKCRELNEPYFKYITSGIPFVTLKLACSLDGRIATVTGDANWFTSPATHRLVHRMRRDSNAIMVGSGTAVSDDPALTVRLARPVTHPLRVILSSRLALPQELKLFRDQECDPTVVFTTDWRDREVERQLHDRGVEVVHVGRDSSGLVLEEVLARLGEMGVARLFVDGGGTLAGRFMERGLADRLVMAYAPLVVGARGLPSFNLAGVEILADAERFRLEKVKKSGEDFVAWIRVGPTYY